MSMAAPGPASATGSDDRLCQVLLSLRAALDAENQGNLREAVEQYQAACAHSSSLLAASTQSSTAVAGAAALDGLLQTFSCRMAMLLVGAESASEQTGPPSDSSTADCNAAVDGALLQFPCSQQPQQPHDAVLSPLAAASRTQVFATSPPPQGPQPLSLGCPPAAPAAQPRHQAATAAEQDLAAEMRLLCQREPTGTLDDVIGMEAVKEELEEALFMPLQVPALFQGIRRPPKTFLLHGPPGTGKTLLVEKVAAEGQLTLLALSPSTVLSKWHGESERSLVALFQLARQLQPALIFIDELDSLGGARGGGEDPSARRLLVELLLQMTRMEQEQSVYIFAATNRVQDCDAALLRRFERRIVIPLPSPQERASFISTLLQRAGVEHNLSAQQLEQVAAATQQYSCSDLVATCRQAALEPVRQLLAGRRAGRKRCRPAELGASAGDSVSAAAGAAAELRPVNQDDFSAAMQRVASTLSDAGCCNAGVG